MHRCCTRGHVVLSFDFLVCGVLTAVPWLLPLLLLLLLLCVSLCGCVCVRVCAKPVTGSSLQAPTYCQPFRPSSRLAHTSYSALHSRPPTVGVVHPKALSNTRGPARDFNAGAGTKVASPELIKRQPGDNPQVRCVACLVCLLKRAVFGGVDSADHTLYVGWLAQFGTGSIHKRNGTPSPSHSPALRQQQRFGFKDRVRCDAACPTQVVVMGGDV